MVVLERCIASDMESVCSALVPFWTVSVADFLVTLVLCDIVLRLEVLFWAVHSWTQLL